MAPVRPESVDRHHRRELTADELEKLKPVRMVAARAVFQGRLRVELPPVPPPPPVRPQVTALDRIQTAADLVIAAAEGAELPPHLQEALGLLQRELDQGRP